VYTPDVELLHHESATHGRSIPRADFERASHQWSALGVLDGDRHFHPHLSYMNTTPTFAYGAYDHPRLLNRDLMTRLPRRAILALPQDLRSPLPYPLRHAWARVREKLPGRRTHGSERPEVHPGRR
jgi:hypothetical protein